MSDVNVCVYVIVHVCDCACDWTNVIIVDGL